MNFGQGSLGFNTNGNSGAPFPAGSADNGLSVDPTTFRIVLGNDVGGFDAIMLSNREIPGLSGLSLPQGKFGVGLPGNVVGGSVQNLLANNRFIANENIQSTAFFQLESVPTGNNLIGTCIAQAGQNDIDMTAGFFTNGIGTRVAGLKGTNNIRNNNGSKTTAEICGIVTAFVPVGAILLARQTGLFIEGPDPSVGGSGTVDVITGIRIERQDRIAGLGTLTVGINQEGVNDVNIFAGIPVRSAASSVVIRDNTTNQLKRIAGASGSFTTVDLKTVTVVDGVITAIV